MSRTDHAPLPASLFPRYPPNTLAPDPHQLELNLRPMRRFSDQCPRCRCQHDSKEAVQACQSLVAQREQL